MNSSHKPPLHPKASQLAKTGLFLGLTSFGQLERRIADLDGDKTKGDAFEVFAEAYLATQRKHDAKRVWPLSAAPLEVLRTLGLSEQDYGVDGVFLTLLGHHNAYQVKFRSARTPLTWRELSTFMGLADSPHIRSRILVTNCDELPPVLNERQGFFCIRGSDLDRLQPEDFQSIESWLAESVFETPKKRPQEHQIEALAALVPALKDEARVSAIMACGTGKTLVSLWVAEQLEASQIVVLLPSLALLRQTLHEWLRETNLPALAYLCVCSDPTVTEGIDDALATQQSDLDFEVSTDTNNVRQFLDAPFTGTKVVFSTYQSASVVGQAMKLGEMFDFGVFDEAHKTAGREGRNFGFALDDAKLPIRKRLFVTATPRHYNPHQRDKEGEAQVVFSMDNPAVYGRQAFCLTFGEAARRNIICNYKVIISVITSEMVTNELLSRGEVMVNGDAVRARQVANQIALRDAVEKYGVSKIFTFHKTVKSAGSFVADGSEGIRTHLPDFGSYHVNGDMPTARRERVMREFRGASRAVMSNARCLTEGVDVPAVDMVAFLSPRRSRVDIVQATGRAMRCAPGKVLGYVLVPLYVELAAGESVEDAVSRADFDEVWDVLQSLQEQDEALAELIRQVGEQKGRGKGFDDRGFADRIDFGGPSLSLESLRRAVTTRCLENLYASWDEWFGKLVAFKERFGHCNVQAGWKEDPSLASWVDRQRLRQKKSDLTDEQIRRLEDLGFVWDWQSIKSDETWMKWYEEMKAFKQQFGHCSPGINGENIPLGRWAVAQRVRRKKCVLDDDQIRRLDELGFIWDYQKVKVQETWMKRYRELEAYAREHGNPHVPRTHSATKLASWVWIQRQRKKGTLKRKGGMADVMSAEQTSLLDKLGFWSDPLHEGWMDKFEGLKRHKLESGHCEVGLDRDGDGGLPVWVRFQRSLQSRGKLKPEHKALLDSIGFDWEPVMQRNWRVMYDRLKEYHGRNGHADVPDRWGENLELSKWVQVQRARRKKGSIEDEEVQMLNDLGFTWKFQDRESWEDRLAEVVASKATHGHCDIPVIYPENPKLGRFTSNTRSQRRSGKLTADRIAKLEAIGFVWASDRRVDVQIGEAKVSAAWKARFDELLAYKQTHSDCDVPAKSGENEQLGNWVSMQRQLKKRGQLHPERVRLLEESGFIWKAGTTQKSWEGRYAELLQFKAIHGSCDVPRNWPANSPLAHWVINQRQYKRLGKLNPEHECLLNEAGFSWVKTGSRKRE